MSRTFKIIVVAVTFPIWVPVVAVTMLIAIPCMFVWETATAIVDGKTVIGIDDGGW